MPDTVSSLSSPARDFNPSLQIYQQQPQQQLQLWPQQPWPQQRQLQTPPPQNFKAHVGRRQPEQASQNMEPALLQLAAQIKAMADQQAAQQAVLMQMMTQQASPSRACSSPTSASSPQAQPARAHSTASSASSNSDHCTEPSG